MLLLIAVQSEAFGELTSRYVLSAAGIPFWITAHFTDSAIFSPEMRSCSCICRSHEAILSSICDSSDPKSWSMID
eukprot:1822745-Amphidinium_carterae.1